MTTRAWFRATAAVGALAAATAAAGLTERTTSTARTFPVAAAAVPASTTSVSPAYLPAGSGLAWSSGSDARFPGAAENQYTLPGAANANTIPPGGIDESNARTVHPETVLSVSFQPGVATLPPVIADPEYFDVSRVLVAGLPALLSTPKRGFGVQRVDWVDAAGYHVVMCDRLAHVEGLAGVEPDELVRVASSLYA